MYCLKTNDIVPENFAFDVTVNQQCTTALLIDAFVMSFSSFFRKKACETHQYFLNLRIGIFQ